MWWFILLCATSVHAQNVQPVRASVSEKCTTIIQAPSALDTFDMLKRTLSVNCFEYYNVAVSQNTMSTLKSSFEHAVDAAQKYEGAYSTNEHVLYVIKAWLNMDAAEPLTKIQRALKECNSQLLVNFFGSEDIRLILPTFISSLEYMKKCFERVLTDSVQERAQLLQTYADKERAVANAAHDVREAHQQLTATHDAFYETRDIFKQAVADSFESVVR